MKKFLVVVFSFLFLGNILAQEEKIIVNDKNAQARNVSGFKEISVAGGIDLYLSPDDKETVVVSASDEKYRDHIVTRVVDGRLEIYFDERKGWRWPSNMRLKAYVSFRSLKRLLASGSSDVFVNGIIKSDQLRVDLSGASDFKGAIDVNELVMEQSGSSDSRISGRADRLKIGVSGASDMKAYDLQVNYCDANASGASDIQITVNKELSAKASGASDIEYRGSGLTKEIKTSGSSSVSRKG